MFEIRGRKEKKAIRVTPGMVSKTVIFKE